MVEEEECGGVPQDQEQEFSPSFYSSLKKYGSEMFKEHRCVLT